MRKWISFRELFDDPNESKDRGISLESPNWRLKCEGFDPETLEFAIARKPKD